MKRKKQIRVIRAWAHTQGVSYRKCKRLWHQIPHSRRQAAREEMEAAL